MLDLGLPRISGIAVLRAWRGADRRLPVLILTARDGWWAEKVEGFKAAPTIISSNRSAWRKW